MSVLHRAGSDEQGPAWGAWVKLPAPESTEILAQAGFDFCVVDLEHTLLDLRDAAAHVSLGAALGLRVLVRVPDHTASTIQRLLDAGAAGVVVPHVDDVASADRVVAAATFPPRGTRGSGGTSRAGGYGHRSRQDYLASSGLVVGQVESVAAALDVERIATVDGLGATMLGPADLALDPRRAELGSAEEVARRVVTATQAAGRLAGTACPAARAAEQAALGFDFVVCANDTTLLASAAREVVAMLREATAPHRTSGAPA